MKGKFLLITLTVAALSSCSSAYRSGQTPDDVYFSPARTYVETKKENDKTETVRESAEERVIRLGINDYRYRNLDYDYSYNPYRYGYDYGYYYNPYYYPHPVYNNPITPAPAKPNTTPRKTNLSSYNGGYNNTNVNTNNNKLAPKVGNASNASPVGVYINNNTNYNNNNTNSNTNTNNNTNRSYTPATNNSSNNSSSSGSSSSGTTISRPGRSGN